MATEQEALANIAQGLESRERTNQPTAFDATSEELLARVEADPTFRDSLSQSQRIAVGYAASNRAKAAAEVTHTTEGA